MEPEKLYNKISGWYDRRHESPSSLWLRKHEDPIIKKLRGKTVDIGCGTGYDLKLLDDVVGIDPSEKMIEEASKTGKKVIVGKAEKLPFPDAFFDNTISMFCVLNMCDYRKAIAEMARVLKPGGTAVISVASVWDRGYGLKKRFSIKHPAREKTITIGGNNIKLVLFEKNEIISLFEKNGMVVEKFISLFKFQSPQWGDWSSLGIWKNLKLRMDALPFFGKYGIIFVMVFKKEKTI